MGLLNDVSTFILSLACLICLVVILFSWIAWEIMPKYQRAFNGPPTTQINRWRILPLGVGGIALLCATIAILELLTR